jgi:hypothetical protein
MIVATTSFSQQSPGPKLTIKLSIASPVVKLGTPIEVKIVAKNLGAEETVWSLMCDSQRDYTFTVIGPDGKPAKPTPLLQRMRGDEHGNFVASCAITGMLAPGEESTDRSFLGKYFEMTVPGKYIVQATRDSVTSNNLEIMIVN